MPPAIFFSIGNVLLEIFIVRKAVIKHHKYAQLSLLFSSRTFLKNHPVLEGLGFTFCNFSPQICGSGKQFLT